MHNEIVGRTQSGRAGLVSGTAPKFWSKATKKERKHLVIAKVVRTEEEQYKIRALSQRQQGSWTTWEGVVDMWRMPQVRLSFLIRATYDILLNPSNLCRWYGSEENCQLCNAPNPSLQHILSSCKTAVAQGRYRWPNHDQVLRKLAEGLKARRLEAAKDHPSTSCKLIHFVGQGAGAQNIAQRESRSLLTPGCDWNLRVDLDCQLKFPTEITTTSLRPDIILWSPSV